MKKHRDILDYIDLRTFPKKEGLGLTTEQQMLVREKLKQLNVNIVNEYEGMTSIKISGSRPLQIGKNTTIDGYIEDTWSTYDLIKKLKQYDKLVRKVDRFRKKEGLIRKDIDGTMVDTGIYKPKDFRNIIAKSSSALEKKTGLDNYIKTLEKWVKREVEVEHKVDADGVEFSEITYKDNRIEYSGKSVRELERLKYESFDNPIELYKEAIISANLGLSEQEVNRKIDNAMKKYKYVKGKRKGQWKKGGEEAFISEFNHTVVEMYEAYEGEFFGWLDNTQKVGVNKEGKIISGREVFTGLDREEKIRLYKEYTEKKLKGEYRSAYENESDISVVDDISDEFIEQIVKRLNERK